MNQEQVYFKNCESSLDVNLGEIKSLGVTSWPHRKDHHQIPEDDEVNSNGQDAIGFLNHDDGRAIMVADGHGTDGHKYSAEVVKLVKAFISQPKRWKQLKSLDEGKIRDYFSKIFNFIHTDLTRKHGHGGTTISIVLLFKLDDGVKLVSINLGDSPIYLHKEGEEKAQELFTSDSCDKPEAVQRYYEQCINSGVKPKIMYLSRFNCPIVDGYGNLVIPSERIFPHFTDDNGNLVPIQIFEYKAGKVVLHRANYDKFVRAMTGKGMDSLGQQTQGHKEFQLIDGCKVARDGEETVDQGVTIEGDEQMLGGLGDAHQNGHFFRVPNVKVVMLTEKGNYCVAGATDGCVDMFISREAFMRILNGENPLDSIKKTCVHSYGMTREYANHDDISVGWVNFKIEANS